jgi:hypothetical protein
MHTSIRYWIGVASREHVMKGICDGFAQLCHGKEDPLKKMNTGDWIIITLQRKVCKKLLLIKSSLQ